MTEKQIEQVRKKIAAVKHELAADITFDGLTSSSPMIFVSKISC